MKLILFLLAIIILLLGITSLSTAAYFNDGENSNTNRLTAAAQVTVTLINESFENTPWAANWDGNGASSWLRKSGGAHTGSYSAECKKNNNGYLTSDDQYAANATMIKISFWFKPASLAAGDMLLQTYNGTAYNTWYDLRNYPSYQNNAWSYFSQNITDSQYFKSNFRLRFDGSAITATNKDFLLDDVVIQRKNWP